jgi:peptidoglycan hydrolase-like protein with peptidoglycan-binding domain
VIIDVINAKEEIMANAKKSAPKSGALVKKSKINVFQIAILVSLFVVAGVIYKVYSHGGGCTNSALRSGDKGTCVTYMQKMLNAYSMTYGTFTDTGQTQLKPDGSFGPATKAKVMDFQKYSNDRLSRDGVAGKATWKSLCGYTEQYVNSYGYGGSNVQSQAAIAGRSAGCVWFSNANTTPKPKTSSNPAYITLDVDGLPEGSKVSMTSSVNLGSCGRSVKVPTKGINCTSNSAMSATISYPLSVSIGGRTYKATKECMGGSDLNRGGYGCDGQPDGKLSASDKAGDTAHVAAGVQYTYYNPRLQ